MADQVIPIQDIASLGVIKDTPSIALPPNAYSDIKNIRFHSGAARKMEGEKEVTGLGTHTNIVYAAYWKAPQNNYYIVIDEGDSNDIMTVYQEVIDAMDNVTYTPLTQNTTISSGGTWQHTLFNGGFNIIFNNGIDVPLYLTDVVEQDTLTTLPNWDSYLAQENVTTVTWDEFNNEIELGRGINYTTENILYSVTPRDTSIGIINFTATEQSEEGSLFSVIRTDPDNIRVVPRRRTDMLTGALPGDQITISIQTKAAITVRAGVIRAYGNLLVAGNLTEMDSDDIIIRRLPGTIRTSDVAAPGVVPLNWNPFRVGANTADEFILSSTGVVQDMAELQGVMYVYTDDSIHGIQQTGNPTIPFQISTVTDSYGCNSLGAVMEFDGRHLVVGSQDIYVFAGHPGSIASIADGRVRHYAYGESPINTNNIRMVRNQKYDEIWIFTPDGAISEMLVWNYRSQAWTIRDQTPVYSGTQGIDSPLFTTLTQVFEADKEYTDVNDMGYESFVARMRLGLTPEFDTETLGATAMMYTSPQAVDLTITMRGSNYPSDIGALPAGSPTFTFYGARDYKVDSRIQGRFVNYKISDDSKTDAWNLTGYQLEIMKGGKR